MAGSEMYDIRDVRIGECGESLYVKPQRIRYVQGGKPKFWDIVETHDSVSVMLYHVQKEAFILVKQFRPSIYLKNGDGFTYELCAGLVDKEKSLEEITQEEILEECGYDVPLEKIQKVTSFYTSVGFSGGCQNLFFAEVDAGMMHHEGGGIDEEMIEVIYLPRSEAMSFIMDETKAKTPGLMFSFMWFFENYS